MRTIAITALAVVGLAACISITTSESFAGEPEATSLDLRGYDEIRVSTGIEVTFIQAPAYSVEVEAPDGQLDRLEAKVKDGVLILSRDGKNWVGRAPRYLVTVTGPSLTALNASSGSSFATQSVSAPQFDVDLSSGASASIKSLETGALSVDASSGASLSLGGTCGTVDADASSGASISAWKLSCATGTLDASSGASISIDLSDSVTADASSGGSVNVSGNPSMKSIKKSVSGSVNVTR